jgi:hypothetical protein
LDDSPSNATLALWQSAGGVQVNSGNVIVQVIHKALNAPAAVVKVRSTSCLLRFMRTKTRRSKFYVMLMELASFCDVNVDGEKRGGYVAEIYCRFGQSVASSGGLWWHSAAGPVHCISHFGSVLCGRIDMAHDYSSQYSDAAGDPLFLHQRYILQLLLL